MNDRGVNLVDSNSVVGSRIKLNCERLVLKCEDQTIAVFQNLKIRRRPENIQHRVEHLKMGLINQENSSWEFYMDLLYITFPYRYKFRDIYQEASSIRRFLRKLQSDESIYHELDELTTTDELTDSSSIHTPNDTRTGSSKFFLESPTATMPSNLLLDSDSVSKTTPIINHDRILHIKRLIIEIKDDPFECKLNDIHTILLDEFAMHEKRVNKLREQLTRAAQSGIRISDEERQACFARIEIQRANEYRNRLTRFYQDYAISDELFIFTMDNLKIKALADGSLTTGEQIIEQMKMMDNESPWPNLTDKDFCTLWCRIITLNVDRWRFQLRDYPKPCWDVTDLFLWGKLVIAEQVADEKGQRKVSIEPGKPWPKYTLIRGSSPTKFYYDLNADVKSLHICYGANWEPTISWLNQRLDDIKPLTKDKSYPPLGWWDKSRLLLHGRFLFAVDAMHWLYSTSLSPYNSTEFFTWQWNRVVVNWENGVIRVDGDLDIVYQTASKYDGICRLFHWPRLEMTVRLDWLSLRDPNDHHSVKYCCTENLSPSERLQHDSFKYFRANRLAMQVNFTVKPPPTGSSGSTDQRPWCLFYTSVLKFADKLRVCLSQISRPIRRGSLYNYNPPRKPQFGRLIQSLDFSFNLPQLELIFWVSYAKRTGVHLTTGPIQVIGKLKREIENEVKVRRIIVNNNNNNKISNNFYRQPYTSTTGNGFTNITTNIAINSSSMTSNNNNCASTLLHPYVMIPPRLPIQRNGLSRRPIASWCVLHLFASVHDSAIRLRHRDNLPGPLVQMLLQYMNEHQNQNNLSQSGSSHHKLNKPSVTTSELEQDAEEMNDAEAFILVPLLRYQQLCPSVLPPNVTVRVHIPGPRSTTMTNANTTTATTTTPTTTTNSTTTTTVNSNTSSNNNNNSSENGDSTSHDIDPTEDSYCKGSERNTLTASATAMNTSVTLTPTATMKATVGLQSDEKSPYKNKFPSTQDNVNNTKMTTTDMNANRTDAAKDVDANGEKHQLTHEELTPVHHLEIHEFKMRWTEHNRNLVYILMDSYQHAQSLKKNLSARALHGFKLHPGQTGTGTTTTTPMTTTTTTTTSAVGGGVGSSGGFGLGKLSIGGSNASSTVLSRNARSAIQLSNSNQISNMHYKLSDHADKRPGVRHTGSHRLLRDYDHTVDLLETNDLLCDETANIPTSSSTTTTKIDAAVGKDNPPYDYEFMPRKHSSSDVDISIPGSGGGGTDSPSISSRKSKSSHLEQIPMLAQLLEEVDTARFYAYCEEEPKQTDVVSQLQGLNICASSLVAERNWHIELINPQLLLKTNHLAGYVLVSAARAKLDALTHPPIWKDSQLLNKSSLVGHLECMQYYATVGQVLPGTPDQWLSTADVSDWAHHGLNADEDALTGRPEVVGCGRSVGGVVTACVGFPQNISSNKSSLLARQSIINHAGFTANTGGGGGVGGMSAEAITSGNTTLVNNNFGTFSTTANTITSGAAVGENNTNCIRPIQLQRMISRCSCEVFYIHYEPADPANLPLPHLIPPLSLDETEVVHNPEGADTVTLLHHTLNVFTNSLQYHMIVDIVNDLLLYVEPQRKAQSERNRVAFGLMSESQVRLAILRDQEALRRMILDQRHLERYLWSYVSQTMQELGLNTPIGYPNSFQFINNYSNNSSNSNNPILSTTKTSMDSTFYERRSSNITLKLVNCIQGARHLETQINTLKSSIIDLNAILSQRLAHYQQLQIQAQRRHIRKAMSFKRHPVQSTASSSSSFTGDFPLPPTTVAATTVASGFSGSGVGNLSLIPKQSTEDFNRYSQLSADSDSYLPANSSNNNNNPSSGSGLIAGRGNLRRASSTDYLIHTNIIGNNNSTNINLNQNQSVTESILSENVNKSIDNGGSKPAEVVRRSEVCFEHARWRMTEHDGQIGLADVELRGFIYTKINRQDDSGSHRLELGWIRVSSLAPNSFYKEVLAPDVSGGRYAGGPILRIACSALAPVGGISVKEAMEISVAPIVLQMSKQFYRIMMPFFFPEKSEESNTTTTTTGAATTSTTATSSTHTSAPTTSINSSMNNRPIILSNQMNDALTTNTGLMINPSGSSQQFMNLLQYECMNSNALSGGGAGVGVGVGVGSSDSSFHPLESTPDTQHFLDPSVDNMIMSRKSWIRRYLSRYFPHRQQTTASSSGVPGAENEACQQLNISQKSSQPMDTVDNASSLSVPLSRSSPLSTSKTTPVAVSVLTKLQSPSNLTIEAAISGRNYCSVNDDDWVNDTVNTSTFLLPNNLLQKINMRRKFSLQSGDYQSKEHSSLLLPPQMDYATNNTGLSSSQMNPMKAACYYPSDNTDLLLMRMMMMTTGGTHGGEEPQSHINLCTRCRPPHLITGSSSSHCGHPAYHQMMITSAYNPMDYGSVTIEQAMNQINNNNSNIHNSNNNNANTSIPLNPVDVMRERARQNNVFLYIKIPGFPIRLSYKGEKQKNITDVTRFELFIPTLEYHNCVWTWLDFAMEVKTRIRKQLVREVIKKKFTPRRRLPFLRGGVPNQNNANNNNSGVSCNITPTTADVPQSLKLKALSNSSGGSSSSLLPSVGRFSSSLSTNLSAVTADIDSTAAQEEKAQRELEMILGRHAQIQPQQGTSGGGKLRRRRKSKV
ncbi:unnamed protein product [Trichobilharzia szidati]|nr:unnamed protein product [Trichobilharzia szidati]